MHDWTFDVREADSRNRAPASQQELSVPTTYYTLIVGTKNWSTWSLRPYLALRATGAGFDEIVIKLRQPETRAQIRDLTGSSWVPVLKIEEGGHVHTVFDSLAICETLAERHPEAMLWPCDAVARARARSISAAMHSGFAALRATLPMDLVRRLPTPELNDEVGEQIAQIIRYWQDALAHFGTADGFLFGHFSIADCMYAPVLARFRTYGIALPGPLDAYAQRMLALPALRDWEQAAQAEADAGVA
jgi:glutathione S-transferase